MTSNEIADLVRRVREAAEASRLGLVHIGHEFLETLADALEQQTRELEDCRKAANMGFHAVVENAELRQVLASPDDGWVKVDEENPLPNNLKVGDEIRGVALDIIIEKLPLSNSARKRITAYRRRSSPM
jgi:hypothetical protein